LLKARQSGLWHRATDGTERERTAPPVPLVYDPDHLAGFVEELERDDAAWNCWFSRFGIEPVRLTYEGLAAEPKGNAGAGFVRFGPGCDDCRFDRCQNCKTRRRKPAWNGLAASAQRPRTGKILDSGNWGQAPLLATGSHD
jgi:hypothetical protein